jgi:hypothetical protein
MLGVVDYPGDLGLVGVGRGARGAVEVAVVHCPRVAVSQARSDITELLAIGVVHGLGVGAPKSGGDEHGKASLALANELDG